MLGMPLTRLEEARDVRLGATVAAGVVEVVLERASETLDVFFCRAGAG
jgi:hypothetical protein